MGLSPKNAMSQLAHARFNLARHLRMQKRSGANRAVHSAVRKKRFSKLVRESQKTLKRLDAELRADVVKDAVRYYRRWRKDYQRVMSLAVANGFSSSNPSSFSKEQYRSTLRGAARLFGWKHARYLLDQFRREYLGHVSQNGRKKVSSISSASVERVLPHLQVIRRVVMSRVHDQDTEDLIGDITIRVLERMERFDSSRNTIENFIASSASREVDDYFRRKAGRYHNPIQVLSLDDNVETTRGKTNDRRRPRLEPADPRAERDVAHRELRADMRGPLLSLPPRQRQMLKLYYQDGLSEHEIGERLGISEAWVSKQLQTARRRLRELLGPHGYS